VCGTPNKRNGIFVLHEAFRLEMMPSLLDIKKGLTTIDNIEKNIRLSQRSGCFKGLVYDIRNEPLETDILWLPRERSNEYRD